MKRWLLIAVAVVLTLGAVAFSAAPAMARDYHSRYNHERVDGYPKTWWRDAARHHDSHRARHVCTGHVRTRGHAGHRR